MNVIHKRCNSKLHQFQQHSFKKQRGKFPIEIFTAKTAKSSLNFYILKQFFCINHLAFHVHFTSMLYVFLIDGKAKKLRAAFNVWQLIIFFTKGAKCNTSFSRRWRYMRYIIDFAFVYMHLSEAFPWDRHISNAIIDLLVYLIIYLCVLININQFRANILIEICKSKKLHSHAKYCSMHFVSIDLKWPAGSDCIILKKSHLRKMHLIRMSQELEINCTSFNNNSSWIWNEQRPSGFRMCKRIKIEINLLLNLIFILNFIVSILLWFKMQKKM